MIGAKAILFHLVSVVPLPHWAAWLWMVKGTIDNMHSQLDLCCRSSSSSISSDIFFAIAPQEYNPWWLVDRSTR